MGPPRIRRRRTLSCVSACSFRGENICSSSAAGYSFFDSGEVELLGRKKVSPFADVGECFAVLVIILF